MTDSGVRLLRSAVRFALLPAAEPELRMLHRCFETWRGIGDVVRGMTPWRAVQRAACAALAKVNERASGRPADRQTGHDCQGSP